MSVLLGIDTGGTYTDAVLFDSQEGSGSEVLALAKALTRRHDLSLGIRESLEQVLRSAGREDIELVSLSTTLATNAIVEGQGGSICLILIGYPSDALEQSRLGEVMAQDPVVFVPGGHDATGEEVQALDLAKARRAVETFAANVSAFAVSGYFSVRNPSHENAVRGMIREASGLPVTCGHELTSNLHASRRALTAALNARLVSVLSELIRAVQNMLAEQKVRAPLMVVKGDGSLVEAAFALEYPIETILSGPAASVVGSLYLSDKPDACVVDMGGTTTDIALVRGGKPILNRDGATVGGWQTMVEAVQIHTYGLGGDSEVHLDESGRMDLGPRRLIPLSLLAHENPEILEDLKRQRNRHSPSRYAARYALIQKSWKQRPGEVGESQRRVLQRLNGEHPVALDSLFRGADSQYLLETQLLRLTKLGYIAISGFTPTDAAHVLGLHSSWSREAAALGAELVLRSVRSESVRIDSAEQLCREVLGRTILQAGRAVTSAVLAEAYNFHLESFPAVQELFVDRALQEPDSRSPDGHSPRHPPAFGGEPPSSDLFGVGLSLRRPLVAIGAPVATYFPEVARSLHTELVIPDHAEVANAIGAVVGSIMQAVRVLITPQDGGEVFRAHCEDGLHDFTELEEAAAFALRSAKSRAEELARRAGAASVTVSTEREDHNALAAGDEFFVHSLITATATGRPHLAHDR
ncbi:MAG: hydantoinase/oxoprolinase family protein [Spirochaetaceae bacterium]|nr:MAG: hydantoinase/oxoprolinase family protein [Spirochaetaceae bacterium]